MNKYINIYVYIYIGFLNTFPYNYNHPMWRCVFNSGATPNSSVSPGLPGLPGLRDAVDASPIGTMKQTKR